MALIVQKYGGSSVADVQKIKRVAQNISKFRAANNQVVVVVSALGDTTDELIKLAKEINPKPSKREMDMLLATGEQVSIALLAMALDAIDIPVISLTGPQVGIITDSVHTKARIKEIKTAKVLILLLIPLGPWAANKVNRGKKSRSFWEKFFSNISREEHFFSFSDLYTRARIKDNSKSNSFKSLFIEFSPPLY